MRKLFYSAVRAAAEGMWTVGRAIDRRYAEGSFQPKWAPAPLIKSRERSKPTLGFPRETDSLCPGCVKEVREQILSGEADWSVLVNSKAGEIKASIVEKDGSIVMEKDCPTHGHFEDVMSTDPAFFARLESLYPGRDYRIPKDGLHEHGSSSIKYGRGAVLTIDLTNRCNMMCNPCFMDANQVGFVHELEWEDVKELLDNAAAIKPKRQLSVQFSGGEPTLSPHFLPAIKYARQIGYFSVQCATNGIRFAQDEEFAREASEAGLRFAYLQFDGVGNDHNEHRQVGNLFDVKLAAIENLKKFGVDVTLVTTIINSVNNDQVGAILNFAIENIDKINALSFQPVSFTGRDEDIDAETLKKQRYTLSHLAHDVKDQAGIGEVMRDWFPLSASGPFSDLKDQLSGLESEWGSMKCGCHPNCGIGTMLLVDEGTKKAVPVPSLINVDQLLKDFQTITDSARSKAVTAIHVALSVLRNLRPAEPPEGARRALAHQDHGRPHGRQARHREEEALLVARALHRRHVVPGPLQLRLPPHGDVHHPVRDADGGDLVLRLQHGSRAGERSSKRSSDPRRPRSGTRRRAATRCTRAERTFRCRRSSRRPRCRSSR